MITLGVDLSAQPKATACCALVWESEAAEVLRLESGFDDAALVQLVEELQPAKVAIDAPFGWPLEFTRTITEFTATGRWRHDADRRPLLFRATDLFVREVTGADPLSVSSNLLAICAMRCARLLNLLNGDRPLDRTGASLLVEVYPAAALRQWGLDPRGYKGAKPERKQKRRTLVERLVGETAAWLRLDDTGIERLSSSDHLLDALIAAIVARAAALGQTLPIPPGHREAAAAEGWIHIPVGRPLRELDLAR
jgi:predicted nuclease with RNAse H fold